MRADGRPSRRLDGGRSVGGRTNGQAGARADGWVAGGGQRAAGGKLLRMTELNTNFHTNLIPMYQSLYNYIYSYN